MERNPERVRRPADAMLTPEKPGASLVHLIATATDDGFALDVAERHDHSLYRGGYAAQPGQ